MEYFADLHIHSCLSPCGDEDMTPANICGMAKLKGLDAIAICDHNSARNLPAAQELCDAYGLLLLPGMVGAYNIIVLRTFFSSSGTESLIEAAKIDGAGEFRTFWTIAMPMVKPAWLTLIIYSFQDLWNAGASIYIHSEQLKSFNYAISQITAGGIKRAGASAAATVIMMLVPITVFVINQSNIIETYGSSGMKD